MGAVTYPNAQVAEFVSERFTAIKFNVKEPHPDFKEALGRGKVLWAPLLVFLDGRGSELRRYVGFLPPDEFLAELRLVLGLAAMTHTDYEGALRLRLDTALLPKPFQLSALARRDLQLETPWKRFVVRSPQQLPAPVESREPRTGER